MDDVTGGQDEPKRPVVSRRRGLGKGLGAILPVAGARRRRALPPRPAHRPAQPRRCSTSGSTRPWPGAARTVRRWRCSSSPSTGSATSTSSTATASVTTLLHDAAARLSAARRRSDTVARFAGDEFVVVCPYVARRDLACQMAARILEDLSRPTTVDKVELQLSASIGVVVTSPRDSTGGAPTLETLLGDAVAGHAPRQGRGRGVVEAVRPLDARRHRRPLPEPPGPPRRARGGRPRPRVRGHRGPRHREWRSVSRRSWGGANPGPRSSSPRRRSTSSTKRGWPCRSGRWVLDQALSDLRARHGGSNVGRAHFRVWVKVAPSLVADPALVDIVDELTAKHGVAPSVLGLDIREPSAARAGFDRGEPARPPGARRRRGARRLRIGPVESGAAPAVAHLRAEARARPGGRARRRRRTPDLECRGRERRSPSRPCSTPIPMPERASTLSREAAALVRGLIELGRALELTVVAQGVESEAQVDGVAGARVSLCAGPVPRRPRRAPLVRCARRRSPRRTEDADRRRDPTDDEPDRRRRPEPNPSPMARARTGDDPPSSPSARAGPPPSTAAPGADRWSAGHPDLAAPAPATHRRLSRRRRRTAPACAGRWGRVMARAQRPLRVPRRRHRRRRPGALCGGHDPGAQPAQPGHVAVVGARPAPGLRRRDQRRRRSAVPAHVHGRASGRWWCSRRPSSTRSRCGSSARSTTSAVRCRSAGTIGWVVTRQGLVALGAAVVADALAGVPTLIKSWRRPESESASVYIGSFANAVITLLTVKHFSAPVVTLPAVHRGSLLGADHPGRRATGPRLRRGLAPSTPTCRGGRRLRRRAVTSRRSRGTAASGPGPRKAARQIVRSRISASVKLCGQSGEEGVVDAEVVEGEALGVLDGQPLLLRCSRRGCRGRRHGGRSPR